MVLVCAIGCSAAVVGAAGADSGSTSVGPAWPSYMGDSLHQSLSSETAITPANASSLHTVWHWTPPASLPGQPKPAILYSSPIVIGGRVFQGSNTGVLYALDETTGAQLWSRDLGHSNHFTCGKLGEISTPAVVGDPSRGGASTLYVGGGDGDMYALDPATGAVIWQTLMMPPSLPRTATTTGDRRRW